MRTAVIYHRADADGWFCREIARKFLPDAELIGWDFSDKPLEIPSGRIYILDLPVDRVFGFDYAKLKEDQPSDVPFKGPQHPGLVWIDHHKSAIESHPADIPGYRIDGVAAARLAWQYFTHPASPFNNQLPTKQDFIDRTVTEPLAVRLAGEYDVWDKRDPRAEVFQFGLRSEELSRDNWSVLLSFNGVILIERLLANGKLLQSYQQANDASAMHRSFLLKWEGLTFLCLNTAKCNSLTFAAKDISETGHDALMGFYFNGEKWSVSLYHAKHRTDLDLSVIAVKNGGGGHKGACGFVCNNPPFFPV